MTISISHCLCECGVRYYYIRNVFYLKDVNSQEAKYWYDWATTYNQCLCHETKCKARKTTSGCISIRGKADEEGKFVKYIETMLRSNWQGKMRRSAPGKTSKAQFNKIAILQNFECYFCFVNFKANPYWFDPSERGNIAHWDHLQPVCKNGSNSPVNMALTCQECNSTKSDMTEQEFWEYLKKNKSAVLVNKAKALRESQTHAKEIIGKS